MIEIHHKPIHYHFVVVEKAKDVIRPNMRNIAKDLADFILQNGLITSHEVRRRDYSNDIEYHFSLYVMAPRRGLP